MMYVLDSNIISYILKGDEAVKKRFYAETKAGHEFALIPTVYYEVQRGLLAKRMSKRLAEFEELCQNMHEMQFNKHIWRKSAQIYASLSQQGKLIPDGDIFIAAFCVLNSLALVTHDKNHFERIEGLSFASWKDS